jgi:Uma2 family endonuclease
MSEPAAKPYVTYAEYLATEEVSETKHEWLNGEVFAMAGGTLPHGALAAAVIAALSAALRGRPCRVFTSDVRVRVQETGLSTYPDVSVACGRLETAPEDRHALVNPVVLVEVLSDATEAYDRGEKFAHYRRIPSLQEYVLVSQSKPRIEVFRRTTGGKWELDEAEAGATLELTSVGCQLSVDEIYRDPLAVEG